MCLPSRPIELDRPEGPLQDVFVAERNSQQEGCISQAWLSVPSLLIWKLGRVTEVAMDVRSCVLSERHLARNTSGGFLIIAVARLWPISIVCDLSLWRAVSLCWLVPWGREQGRGANGPPLPLLFPYSCPLIQSSASMLCHFFFSA